MSWKDIISLLCRIIVGGVLIYSGTSKAIAPSAEFAAALAAYRILPEALIPTIAQVWPWLELLTGTYLFFGYYARLFAGVAAGMFLVFLTVLLSALLRKIDPGSCGCFGVGLTFSLGQTALLDSLLLALSITLLTLINTSPPHWSADSWIDD